MDQQTIDTYNQMAKEYDQETVEFWNTFPRSFLDRFIDLSLLHFDQREKSSRGFVLDVGSGPGRDGLILQSVGLNVVCLDASRAMIDLSTERGLKSVLGDLLSLPFENESFDSVWAYTSLLHIPKSQMTIALSEIHRVLKPNGVFALGMIEGDEELYRSSSGVTLERWFSFYQKEELETLLIESGFEIVYFEMFKPRSKNYLQFILRRC